MDHTLLTVSIDQEHDVVLCRQRARQIAALLGFDLQDQTRIATAVSEIARNSLRYATGGRATFAVSDEAEPCMLIRIHDRGPGIDQLETILAGNYVSATGMGLGINGARRLMDRFEIQSSTALGTRILLGRNLSFRHTALTGSEIARLTYELARSAPQDAFAELRQQNAELVQAMRALQDREEELTQQRNQLNFLNEELADTNRGVVALNKELEEKAEAIRQAGEVKSRFLSHMTHEFRTPLNSILSLTRILLSTSENDGLSAERQKQIHFIRKSAEQLSDMINDMLDTAKLEAGRLEVQTGRVEVAELFGSLRAMFRPLLSPERSVELNFEIDEGFPLFDSDELKIAQILRNFISNALKFTVQGEVKVRAQRIGDETLEFSVIDSGIGISKLDQERIFEEFTQLDHPLQRRSKGTGLGLPLARRLAQLLGGVVSVSSEPGQGSTFRVRLPLRYAQSLSLDQERPPPKQPDASLARRAGPPESKAQRPMDREDFQAVAKRSLAWARQVLQDDHGRATREGHEAWPFIMNIDRRLAPGGTAILYLSLALHRPERMADDETVPVRPEDQVWFINRLQETVCLNPPETVLIIDDDEVARYLLRELLKQSGCRIFEATGGQEGLQIARESRPQVIFLDLRMHDMSGYEVLEALKSNPATRAIPIIIHSSVPVKMSDFDDQKGQPIAILSKEFSKEHAEDCIRDALCQAGLVGLRWNGVGVNEHA